jgi:SAM-dependent methyltransferase
MPLAWMQAFALLLAAIEFSDIPASLWPFLHVSDAAGFVALRQKIEQDTSDRLQRGEQEHLIYFILQSKAFTTRARIEPAWSARESRGGKSVPQDARERMADFLAALERPSSDPRLAWWKSSLQARSLSQLSAAYARAMRFLYEKEFGAGSAAALYQQRGYSTDTQVEANVAVSTALAVLRELDPKVRVERVLIVGPGLDFAPRTGFRDDLPPQSFQPYLTADILLRRGLSSTDRLRIDCADISPRVVEFIEDFSRREKPKLVLPRVFDDFGRHIGSVSGNTITVRKEIAARINASKLNILTERLEPVFDLVIATNVLLYFNETELALALANIHAMLRPGGYLIHNEPRPELEAISTALRMPPIQGRTLQIAQGAKQPLADCFVIHRR